MTSALDARRELARREHERREATRHLGPFVARFDSTYDAGAAHTKLICAHLEALERREIENLALFMPPQHGKSMHATESYPAFAIGRCEERGGKMNVAVTAYGANKAEDYSSKNRDKIRDSANPFATRIHPEFQAKALWKTIGGSQCVAAGVGGPLTGHGAHLLVIDDPVKSDVEALSATDREHKWQWYLRVARTRLRKRAQQLLCQTRWHEDDLAGRILNTTAAKRWTIVTLPARCVDPATDPLGRELGALLWPDGPEIPTPGDGTTTTKVYEAMYQQNPTPDDGTVFRREWLAKMYSAPPTFTKAAIFLDGAWKDGLGNDRSALAAWATDGIDYYLVDAWAERLEYPDLKAKFTAFCEKHRALASSVTFCVEDAASGIPIIQELSRTTSLPIVGVTVDKSKIVRAEATTPLFEAGKVRLPEGKPWLDEWIEEHVGFPGRKHDDWVDTTSGALARLSNSEYAFAGWI